MPVARVQLPDGRVAKFEVPEGTTQAQVEAEARKRFGSFSGAQGAASAVAPAAALRPPIPNENQLDRMATETPRTSASEAFGRSALSRYLNTLAGVPNLAATAGLRMLTGEPLIETDAMRQRKVEAGAPVLPRVGERVLPLPSGKQMTAGLETAAEFLPANVVREGGGRSIPDRFEQNLEQINAGEAEHPVASGFGELTGDAAAIFTGRVPVRAAARRSTAAVQPSAELSPGLKRALNTSVQKLRPFGRGAGKAAEAGLEGAVLAVLDEGDPLQTAALAAGGQGAGSLMLRTLGEVRKHSLGSTVLGLLVAHQMFRAVGPGEKNIFESSDQAFNDVIAAYGIGALAALAGAGRINRRGFAEDFPDQLTDGLTAIPRGAFVSFWNDLSKDPETLNPVIEKYTEGGFNQTQRARIERAWKNGNLGSEVEKMMGIQSFREALDD